MGLIDTFFRNQFIKYPNVLHTHEIYECSQKQDSNNSEN